MVPKLSPEAKRRLIKRISISVVALLCISIGGTVLVNLWKDRRERLEFQAARHRIAPGEIEFADLQLISAGFPDYFLVGRVRNHSGRHTLETVILTLTVREEGPPGTSEIVGEADSTAMVTVPPGQTRELKAPVTFENLPKPRGRLNWTYAVREIYAK